MGPEVVVEPEQLDVEPVETAAVRACRRLARLRWLAFAPLRWWGRLLIRYLGRGDGMVV